ncbi:MAG TPA: cupin domain-containing protein [Actinopolymorphaceae bacterium]
MSFPSPPSGSSRRSPAYPAPTYHGETGEVSAILRPAGAAPELSRPATHTSYLATNRSTNGQFGLYRVDFTGPPTGPDPHFHRTMSESFFVLSGTVRLYDGERWIDGNPGDFLFVPEGGIHGFKNESGEPASMLLLFAPGADREAYFEGVSAVAEMSEEERLEFFLRHDNHWV